MKYILRPYQQESVNKGIEFLLSKSKKNGIIVAPTGSGKSLIIANIAKQLPGKTIIFQPSKELLEQNFEKYISYGEFAEIYSASASRKKISDITFATIGSVVKKPHLFEEFQFCIVDECHLVSPESGTMYKTFFDSLTLKVLGLTATPIRMKRYNFPYPHAKLCMLDRMRPKFFSEYIHITQISEMKKMGYFVDIDYIEYDFKSSLLKINSTGGDYTEKSMSYALKASNALEKIAKTLFNIREKGIINHPLIFVQSINDAMELEKLVGKQIIRVVTGQTPKKERKEIIENFKSGKLSAVVNVGVLTTGFDFPELDCIINARPTMSLGLYYQIVGRCVRPHSSKKKAYVLDFSGNYKRFGKVEELNIQKHEGKWIISNGDKILTNVDISGQQIDGINNNLNAIPIMPFGKYKNKLITEIAEQDIDYLKWWLKDVERTKYTKHIHNFIESNNLISN